MVIALHYKITSTVKLFFPTPTSYYRESPDHPFNIQRESLNASIDSTALPSVLTMQLAEAYVALAQKTDCTVTPEATLQCTRIAHELF